MVQVGDAESFDFQAFNTGDYYGAVVQKIVSENTTKVLYPNDEMPQGKQLRLEQQYFFASCALRDMIRIYLQRSDDLSNFHEKFVVQLNDTHPAIAVAELMRLLVDEHDFAWEDGWKVTRNTFAYTNHTLLPEALAGRSLSEGSAAAPGNHHRDQSPLSIGDSPMLSRRRGTGGPPFDL